MIRIANHKIPEYINTLTDFVNYNRTITGNFVNSDLYEVWHWNTKILSYNATTKRIEGLTAGYISQTTSTLVGKLLRSLPEEAVNAYLESIRYDRNDNYKRLSRMVKH